jgi:hypothetical protein
MFIDRQQELAFLNAILTRTRPSPGQMVLLYGRRRVGKTVLARHWAESTRLPVTYWAAECEPAPLQRRKLFAKMLNLTSAQAPVFETWADLWTAFAQMVGERRQVLILDEITHAAESDPAFLSALQHAWDQQLKTLRLVLLLSGSHVHTMETLLAQGSPLFGRFTGQWHLQPLEFGALHSFLPKWTTAEQVEAYAIVGGVPAYLEWLDPGLSLADNIEKVLLAPGTLFVVEPDLLLYDELHEPRVYLAILQAIGLGAHTLDEIANQAMIGKTHLPAYLTRLQELRLVERRLPVTVPPAQRRRSRLGRYHLTDPFLRFYFRFIAPHRTEVGYKPEAVVKEIQEHFRGFVGATAFEELCRLWTARASEAGEFPFAVEQVGSHWSRLVQADVVAVNWSNKAILIGECKWGTDAVPREVVQDLVQGKAPQVLRALPEEGSSWSVYHAVFSRAGLTPAAREVAKMHKAIVVDLVQLERDLHTE